MEAEQNELNQAYAAAFSTADGKRVLQDLCDRFCVFSGSFADESTGHAYNEGMRSVALYILNRMDYSSRDILSRFQTMLKAHNDNKEAR